MLTRLHTISQNTEMGERVYVLFYKLGIPQACQIIRSIIPLVYRQITMLTAESTTDRETMFRQ